MAGDKKAISFGVYAPSYDENSGGIIVLHLLCHYLNMLGYKAYLIPHYANEEVNIFNFERSVTRLLANLDYLANFEVMPNKIVPVYPDEISLIHLRDDIVVVYPETTFGNPLGAKHVARWLLYTPGFFTDKVYFSKGEIQFAYERVIQPLEYEGFRSSELVLKIRHIPFDIYNMEGAESPESRHGTAYCVRKGLVQKNIHEDPQGFICVDGLPHKEIAKIFKRVEFFVSYDSDTLYSWLAPLCGAKSVIAPSNEHLDHQKKIYRNQPGIAYGFEDLSRASKTVGSLVSELKEVEALNLESVKRFASFWAEMGSVVNDASVANNSTLLDNNGCVSKERRCLEAILEIVDLSEENNRLSCEIRDLRNSSSWKITAPLRWVRSSLVIFRHGLQCLKYKILHSKS